MKIGTRAIGPGHPCYVVGEIGINHNGDPGTFLQIARMAKDAGCDAVKGQIRTPDVCVPPDQRDKPKSTPWGEMTYLEYKRRMEFDADQWAFIRKKCAAMDVALFASCWDVESVERNPWLPMHKVASAMLTNVPLLEAIAATGKPVILSTGMSTLDEIDAAVQVLGTDSLVICQATSAYPVEHRDIHLHVMEALRSRYGVPVGYSGHERGLAPTLAAVAMGANLVERHITLDRTWWGTDQAASLEPRGVAQMVRDIRATEEAHGTAEKLVLACEMESRAKLRGA